MHTSTERFGRIDPTLIERQGGGWLAVSRPPAPLLIGVSAPSSHEARELFDRAVHAWAALWDAPGAER